MKMKKFFSIVLLGAMCMGFVSCENDEPEVNNNGTDQTDPNGDDSQTPPPAVDYVYDIILMTDNLIGATATLSQNGVNEFTDEVILTIKPIDERMYWKTTPSIVVKNAEKGNVTETDGVYTWKLTAFADNTTVTISGATNAITATLVVEDLIGATATLSKETYLIPSDTIYLTITPNYEEWEGTHSIEDSDDYDRDWVSSYDIDYVPNVRTYRIYGFWDDFTVTITEGKYINTHISASTGSENGHGYVDLGLPSGTLWATCNVGANSPEEYGDYFAWGEVKPKTEYNYSNYNKNLETKYSEDGLTTLEATDDAATQNWGGDWRMPTKEEFDELKNKDNCTWGSSKKLKGIIVTSKKNGNSIFLPAAGIRVSSSLYGAGTNGNYWSSSLGTAYPYDLFFFVSSWTSNGSGSGGGSSSRPSLGSAEGHSVRAVCSPKK